MMMVTEYKIKQNIEYKKTKNINAEIILNCFI